MTRSPGLNPVTPSPTATTSPAASLPGIKGGSGPELVFAGEHQHVDVLHAARADPHLHLAGPRRRRVGQVAPRQHLGTAKRLAYHRLHAPYPYRQSSRI